MSDLFETYKLSVGMTDVCHLSLAYFGDFRIERNTDNDLDQQKVDAAYEELDGQKYRLKLMAALSKSSQQVKNSIK